MPSASRKPNSTTSVNEAWLVRHCPFSYTLSLVGRRWRPAVLWKLVPGPLHVAELARQLPRASEKMLAQELRALADADLVARRGDAGRTYYALTPRGHALVPVLMAMFAFGERHREEDPAPGPT
jgi:DNA-binding HxlR family transcriptional regulator